MKEEEQIDEIKRKRLEKNKAAAMRSRLKKKLEAEQLRRHVSELSESNHNLKASLQHYEALLQAAYSENLVLKANICYVSSENELLKTRDESKIKNKLLNSS
ncbi:unnamed protein product [Blepharisma stoltei]|uniref:BZIP domain-containing protein n=1 Tax=Blepharisma stoltei TaxID=1481888 RepID=A0AAU9ICN9_9CILI|nr:unnamed protein product [Blepharisma stoltei]